MTIAPVPLIAALIGLLMFVLAKSNMDVKRIGELLMFAGMLVTLLSVAGHVVHLF